MEDYYRVRFKKLIRPPAAPLDVEAPRILRLVYGASCVGTALGWLAVVALGRSWGAGFPWLALLSLSFPIWLVLYLGFSENQAWTRPLMVTLLLLAALLFQLSGLTWPAAFIGVFATISTGYLYGSPAVRRYYVACSETALVRIEGSDLRSAAFVPLYTATAGILSGGWLGYRLVTEYLGYSSGLGANDLAGIACAVVLLGSLVGLIGRWLGEAIISRLRRAAFYEGDSVKPSSDDVGR